MPNDVVFKAIPSSVSNWVGSKKQIVLRVGIAAIPFARRLLQTSVASLISVPASRRLKTMRERRHADSLQEISKIIVEDLIGSVTYACVNSQFVPELTAKTASNLSTTENVLSQESFVSRLAL